MQTPMTLHIETLL